MYNIMYVSHSTISPISSLWSFLPLPLFLLTDSPTIIGKQGWETTAKSEISRKIDGNQTHLKLQPYTRA